MKYYIFSKLELQNKIDRLQGTYHNTMDLVEASSLVEEITEGIQTVEKILEGEVEQHHDNVPAFTIGDKFPAMVMQSIVHSNLGKNIKLYIEVSQWNALQPLP